MIETRGIEPEEYEGTSMLWLIWRQHRADRAEVRSIRCYLAYRNGLLASGAPDPITADRARGHQRGASGAAQDVDRV